MKSIYDLTISDLMNQFLEWGEPGYRARQVWTGLYRGFYEHSNEFTMLSKEIQDRIQGLINNSLLVPINVQVSRDKLTEKTLFQLDDGLLIETVIMLYDKRRTICVSTQVGCAMGCLFCATGQGGYKRNLSVGEIISQIIYYSRKLLNNHTPLTNIVFMGMGEPFQNYDNLMAAINTINDVNGMKFGSRRMTISTVGIIPKIRKFTSENLQVNLSVSLHSVDNSTRDFLMPVNKVNPVDILLQACWDYCDHTRRRVTFEYALISGVNDTPSQIKLLVNKLRGKLCHINLIPLNPTPVYQGKPTKRDKIREIYQELVGEGISCTLRLDRGLDIKSGCGQLIGENKRNNIV